MCESRGWLHGKDGLPASANVPFVGITEVP